MAMNWGYEVFPRERDVENEGHREAAIGMGDIIERGNTSTTGFSAWIDRNYRAIMLLSMLAELLLLGCLVYLEWVPRKTTTVFSPATEVHVCIRMRNTGSEAFWETIPCP
jgi:hypothetical protein